MRTDITTFFEEGDHFFVMQSNGAVVRFKIEGGMPQALPLIDHSVESSAHP